MMKRLVIFVSFAMASVTMSPAMAGGGPSGADYDALSTLESVCPLSLAETTAITATTGLTVDDIFHKKFKLVKSNPDVWHIWFSTGPGGGEFKVTVGPDPTAVAPACKVVGPINTATHDTDFSMCDVDDAITKASMALMDRHGATGLLESAKLRIKGGSKFYEVKIWYLANPGNSSSVQLFKTKVGIDTTVTSGTSPCIII